MLGWAQGPRAQRAQGTLFLNHSGHWGKSFCIWDISENNHISEFIPLVPLPPSLPPEITHIPKLISLVLTGCWGGPRAQGPKGPRGPFFNHHGHWDITVRT